jgi:hypothetical protein
MNATHNSNMTKFSFNSKLVNNIKPRLPPKSHQKDFVQMNIEKIRMSRAQKPISSMSITSMATVRSEKSRRSVRQTKGLNVYDSKVDNNKSVVQSSRLAAIRCSNTKSRRSSTRMSPNPHQYNNDLERHLDQLTYQRKMNGKRNNNDHTRSQLELSKPPDYNMITLEHKLSSPD